MASATPNLHVLRDMHGEWRTHEPGNIHLGAHQWQDDDDDGIPNFADTLNYWNVPPNGSIIDATARLNDQILRAAANVSNDHDADGISELQEYMYGTDMANADTLFLSIHQAVRMFAPLGAGGITGPPGLTLQEARHHFHTKTESDGRFWRKTETIRLPQVGDLLMGGFTAGPSLP